MNSPVLSALLPVVLLIAVGWWAGRRGWIGPTGTKEVSNLVFVVLAPALLFRTMATVPAGDVPLAPLASYFAGVAVIFVGTLLVFGLNRRAAVLALAATFSNTVMIGIPVVTLAFGQAGLVNLLPLISVHALVLLTVATIVLELAVVREEQAAGGHASRPVGRTVLLAMRNAIIHPVPLPILAGLAFGQAGWTLPALVDKPLQLLAQAFGPLALLLVGATLASTRVGEQWRDALGLSLAKNVLHPLLVGAAAWAFGLAGVPMAVMVIAASLPIGANVFLFSQRYGVAQELVTSAVAVSTVMALVSLSVVLALVG